jgi:chemotaxis signal transduction protein
VVYGRASIVRGAEDVLAFNLTRLASPRQTGEVDREALAERLRREERVVLVISPEKVLPARFESRR